MSVGQDAHRLGTEHDRRAARLGERPQGGRRMARPAADLDGDAVGLLNPSGGLVDGDVVGSRGRRPTRSRGSASSRSETGASCVFKGRFR